MVNLASVTVLRTLWPLAPCNFFFLNARNHFKHFFCQLLGAALSALACVSRRTAMIKGILKLGLIDCKGQLDTIVPSEN
jgi:hypothetical protein